MTKKTYKVTAADGYDGHEEGETFDAELSKDEELMATARGLLIIVTPKAKPKGKEKDDG